MSYLTRLLPAALICAASASAVYAETAAGQYVVRGIGALKCAQVTEGYSENKARQLELSSWIAGYVSATNMTQDGVFDVFPMQNNSQIAGLTTLICQNKPESSLTSIVTALGSLFAELAVNEDSPVITLKSDTHRVSIREETVLDVQSKLAKLGLLAEDDVDGKFGAKTSNALKEFQSKRKIRATGVPDMLTMYWLTSEKT